VSLITLVGAVKTLGARRLTTVRSDIAKHQVPRLTASSETDQDSARGSVVLHDCSDASMRCRDLNPSHRPAAQQRDQANDREHRQQRETDREASGLPLNESEEQRREEAAEASGRADQTGDAADSLREVLRNEFEHCAVAEANRVAIPSAPMVKITIDGNAAKSASLPSAAKPRR
jgi:hypothetical protein